VAAALLVAVSGPMARVFLTSAPAPVVAALRDTIVAFAPGLPGYALVALLTRALYARGRWRAPTVCVVGGWLLAVVADLVLAQLLPAEDRALALGAGHSLGVTAAGLGLLIAVSRAAGPGALAGLARTGSAAGAGAVFAGAAGLLAARAVGADPVPGGLLPALGAGLLAGAIVLAVAAAVMMGTARRPLAEAWRGLRAPDRPAGRDAAQHVGVPGPAHGSDRREVHGD
jgi:putative peptidoglycan lipid II flippase